MKDYIRLQLKSFNKNLIKPHKNLQHTSNNHLIRIIQTVQLICLTSTPVLRRRIRDLENQEALRIADIKDFKSALVYVVKFEAQHWNCLDKDPRSEQIELKKNVKDVTKKLYLLTETKEFNNKIKCCSCNSDGEPQRNPTE